MNEHDAKEYLIYLIEKEFNSINFDLEFIYFRSNDLIKFAERSVSKEYANQLKDRKELELNK